MYPNNSLKRSANWRRASSPLIGATSKPIPTPRSTPVINRFILFTSFLTLFCSRVFTPHVRRANARNVAKAFTDTYKDTFNSACRFHFTRGTPAFLQSSQKPHTGQQAESVLPSSLRWKEGILAVITFQARYEPAAHDAYLRR